MTGMKHIKLTSPNAYLFFNGRMSFCIGFTEDTQYWVISDYSKHSYACRNARNEAKQSGPGKY